MAFTLQQFLAALDKAPDCNRFVVALSGGVDSVCLIHSLVQLKTQGKVSQDMHAIHIHHGLNESADQWQQFCEAFCAEHKVQLTTRKVEVANQGSIENAARESRYQAFAEFLTADDVLLMGHHADDQLETFMLRLLRGSGVSGLGGMPHSRELGPARLYRPLLGFTRPDIEEYVGAAKLQWMEDSSNQDLQHDRNFLRHHVMPMLAQRWPNYREPWSKSLQLLEEAGATLMELAVQDLREAEVEPGKLALEKLCQLSEFRLRSLLRHWLKQANFEEPGWNLLQAITPVQLNSDKDRVLLETADYRLQEFDGYLCLIKTPPSFDSKVKINMDLQQKSVAIPNNGVLKIRRELGAGLSDRFSQAELRFRDGGEELKLVGRPTKSLKKLFQEQRIQPWVRERIPLVFVDNKLVCVPGIGVAESAQAKPGERGFVLEWTAPEL